MTGTKRNEDGEITRSLPGIEVAPSWLSDSIEITDLPKLVVDKDMEELEKFFGPNFPKQYQYLSNPPRFVFYGEIGVGKSAALCTLVTVMAGYNTPIEPPNASGLCTPFPYEFRLRKDASKVSILIEPQSDEFIKTMVETFYRTLDGCTIEDFEINRSLKNFLFEYRKDDPLIPDPTQ
jgi:hypothetical protein